jgi:16S rRNA G966 N2-methylase RsmD
VEPAHPAGTGRRRAVVTVSGQRRKRLGIRQRRAAELRAQGLSLRAIAARLKVGLGTVHRDLAEWDRTHPGAFHNEAGNATPDVRLGDFQTVLADLAPGSVAAVITDPPYEAEALPQWSDLGKHAARWLRPGGFLVAISGQMHLREVERRLDEHLTYWWEMAYLTQGDAVPVFPRRVHSQWKPVLVYRNGDGAGPPPWFGDVARSGPGRGDKRLHGWAQTESGMADLVRAVTVPGDLIVDPFTGTGTTGAAALALGRRFTGAERNPVDCETARGRLAALHLVRQQLGSKPPHDLR